ncbi:DLA class II histocompatibility antigen, DR-1 beta chain-like isoform X1 [Pelodiscus sinensis]|uniref:DLA class II histocompatibility antigen, DR-1 beta chain-like isoform X1 n=1 Tax=Pelodiscus sinensis TaxID=13735 RepID=UPI003F6D7B66
MAPWATPAWVFWLLSLCSLTRAGLHRLSCFQLISPQAAPGLPKSMSVLRVNDLVLAAYDSGIRRLEPRNGYSPGQQDSQQFWSAGSSKCQGWDSQGDATYQVLVQEVNASAPQAEPYYMQILKTCELDDATGTVQIATRCSLNGEDVLHYRGDQNRWFSVHPAAWRVAERWNRAAEVFGAMNHLTPQQCQSWIQSSASFIAQQTAQPTGHMALVPRTEARLRLLICHVTGFYPRPIKVTWEQGEQDSLWEQLSSGILPNGDHTFQIQVSIELGQEGAGPTEHVCVVRHSSLGNTTLRVTWVQPTGRLHVPQPLGEYLSWASWPGTRNPQAFPHPLLAALSHKLGRKQGDHSSQQVPQHRPRSPPISCWS